MNQEQITQMAREAKIKVHGDIFYSEYCDGVYGDELEAFAKLVAKHTLANIDPSSFMSWQEGYEAGKQDEREECAKIAETPVFGEQDDITAEAKDRVAHTIRARGDQT